jgi:hypothetical protein
MTTRKYFAKSERILLRWDVDDSNNPPWVLSLGYFDLF